ncbi:putative anti-sigma-28 factor, FlgM [Citrifermentans bremense]|uniref:Negative regulator of flagellin synthesis n=1 Tax=Citrifermentans bremense TaxID=60035 RepID=A0A6S6M0W5_9BACT|nr:flagellar biosynthesis anti-sigma factor FlgM [Citrifermentans bremense]BCG48002.1 putative anti-sigma-28 factor, FlgM [Citrifermentans bremense]
MNIVDQTGLTPLQQVQEKEAKSAAAKGSTAVHRQGVDVVEISSALEQQNTVQLEQLQEQRIASIKSQLQAGSYQVDSRLVAQKMLSGDSI